MNTSTEHAIVDSVAFGRGVYSAFIDEFERVHADQSIEKDAGKIGDGLRAIGRFLGRMRPEARAAAEVAAKGGGEAAQEGAHVMDKATQHAGAVASAKKPADLGPDLGLPTAPAASPAKVGKGKKGAKPPGKAVKPPKTPKDVVGEISPADSLAAPKRPAAGVADVNPSASAPSQEAKPGMMERLFGKKTPTADSPATRPTPAGAYRVKRPKSLGSLRPGPNWGHIGAAGAAGVGGGLLLSGGLGGGEKTASALRREALGLPKQAEAAHEAGDEDPAAETEIERVSPVHEFIAIRAETQGPGKAKGIPVISPPPGYVYDPVTGSMQPDMENPGWVGAAESMLMRSDSSAQQPPAGTMQADQAAQVGGPPQAAPGMPGMPAAGGKPVKAPPTPGGVSGGASKPKKGPAK